MDWVSETGVSLSVVDDSGGIGGGLITAKKRKICVPPGDI
jgi:hypothetical protein